MTPDKRAPIRQTDFRAAMLPYTWPWLKSSVYKTSDPADSAAATISASQKEIWYRSSIAIADRITISSTTTNGSSKKRRDRHREIGSGHPQPAGIHVEFLHHLRAY